MIEDPCVLQTVPCAQSRKVPPRQMQAWSCCDAQRTSPLSKVRKPGVLTDGHAALRSVWDWQRPSQQIVDASRQVVPQSTRFPQDFLFLTVPQRPAQILARDLRRHPLLRRPPPWRRLCRCFRRRRRSFASASSEKSRLSKPHRTGNAANLLKNARRSLTVDMTRDRASKRGASTSGPLGESRTREPSICANVCHR